jgi:hypothetical protein
MITTKLTIPVLQCVYIVHCTLYFTLSKFLNYVLLCSLSPSWLISVKQYSVRTNAYFNKKKLQKRSY